MGFGAKNKILEQDQRKQNTQSSIKKTRRNTRSVDKTYIPINFGLPSQT